MEQFEADLMDIYNCDPRWPICLYDFTSKNRCPKFVAYRVQKSLDEFIINDYFHPDKQATQPEPKRANQPDIIPYEELLINRNSHPCCNKEHPNFVQNFKMRFIAEDKYLFENEFLQFDIDDELNARQMTQKFIESIS